MDRRQNKTQAQIKAVFVTLLAEMPIEKITVSRIADLANINRGTFYRHYKDVYDLHDQVLSDLMTDMTQIFKATYPSESTYHDDFKTLSYILSNTNQLLLSCLTTRKQVPKHSGKLKGPLFKKYCYSKKTALIIYQVLLKLILLFLVSWGSSRITYHNS